MSDVSVLIIGISIIISGYFIGNGICKGLVFFKSNRQENCLNNIFSIFYLTDEEITDKKLVNEKYIQKKLRIKKDMLQYLIEEYPGLKGINIKGKIYYKRKSVDEWIESIE